MRSGALITKDLKAYMTEISAIWAFFWLEMSYVMKFQQCFGKNTNKWVKLFLSLFLWDNVYIFGEIYTAGKKFYTAAGSDGIGKFYLYF